MVNFPQDTLTIVLTSALVSGVVSALVSGFVTYFVNVKSDRKKLIFEKKLEIYSKIGFRINTHEYLRKDISQEIVEIFAPARFFGDKETVDELRNYYSLLTEYYNLKMTEQKTEVIKKISKSAMEIEQLMRAELTGERIYSKETICAHIDATT